MSLKVDAANTGATTINISSVGAVNLYYNGTALTSVGLLSLCTNGGCAAYYDGTEFNLILGVGIMNTTGGLSTLGTGSGQVTLSGSSSGSAAIGVPAAAGTPSALLLPTADPGGANYLITNAAPSGGSMQTSWTNSPTISTITNTGTESVPTNTGGIPIVIACGATTTTCANTNTGHTAQVYFGATTLASNTRTVTLSPGFTATADAYCVGNDVTTRANPVQVVPASASTITITNTTGATDVIQWVCVGF